MKFMFVSLILLGVLPVSASSYIGFTCIPSLRDTRIQFLENNNQIEVLVTNAMGYEFMPQFEAPISVFNIPFIKMQGEDLSILGDQFKFSFPKEKCQMDESNYIVNCEGASTNSIKEAKSYGLSTTEITEKHQGVIYEKRKFRLTIDNGNTYFLSLSFDKTFCTKFK